MLDFIFSLLFPKKCIGCKEPGSYICPNCFSKISFLGYQYCAICQKGSVNGLTHPRCMTPYGIDGIISSIAYKGIVKKLIYQFKYRPFLYDLRKPLGRLMCEGLIQNETFMSFINKKDVLITSVPLHPKREKGRGYNQSKLLAQELSKFIGILYIDKILERKIYTKPQFQLTKEERKHNLKNAFSVNMNVKGKNILLVDDITTSGVTLRECGKILKRSGAKRVLGIALAHEG